MYVDMNTCSILLEYLICQLFCAPQRNIFPYEQFICNTFLSFSNTGWVNRSLYNIHMTLGCSFFLLINARIHSQNYFKGPQKGSILIVSRCLISIFFSIADIYTIRSFKLNTYKHVLMALFQNVRFCNTLKQSCCYVTFKWFFV